MNVKVMSTTCDFFQCLICSSFFANLQKVEKHLKTHHQKGNLPENINHGDRDATSCDGLPNARRRGMLPIQKNTFVSCYIAVERYRIGVENPARHTGAQTNYEQGVSKPNVVKKCKRELKSLGVRDDVTEDDILNAPEKRSRRRREIIPVTTSNVRHATVSDDDESEPDNDYKEFIEKIHLSADEDKDDDSSDCNYEAYFCKKGRKRGRPKGSFSTNKKSKQRFTTGTVNQADHRIVEDGNGQILRFKCEHCPLSFLRRKMLRHHILEKHKDVAKLIKCPISICNETSFHFYVMNRHVRLHGLAERKEKELERGQNFETKDVVANHDTMDGVKVSCRFCLTSCCDSLEKLKKHQDLEHGTEINLKCPCCERTFEKSAWNLICHNKTSHPYYIDPDGEVERRMAKKEPKFKCDKCDFKSRNKVQLKSHLRTHEESNQEVADPGRPYKCPTCFKDFKYKDKLKRHFILHLENSQFTCDFPDCNKRFNNYDLRKHKLVHSDNSDPDQLKCPICNRLFIQKHNLTKHMREVHKPDEVVNGVPVAASTPVRSRSKRLPRIYLGKHQKYPAQNESSPIRTTFAATVENPSVKIEPIEDIHLVDRIILQEDGTAVHIKGEHLSPQKVPPQEAMHQQPAQSVNSRPDFLFQNYINRVKLFTCQECQASFSRAWALQLHLKSIHNKTLLDESTAVAPTNNDCEAKETIQKSHLNQVTLLCGTCAYVAKDAKDLEEHMQSSHRSILMFRCVICGISYKSEQRLQNHVKQAHSAPLKGLKYPCKYCSKPFTTRSHARSHEKKVHESKNEERKKCPICLRDFAPRSIDAHLRRHKTKSAEELEKLKCQLCGDVFSCNAARKRHIDCVHLDKPLNKMRKKKKKVTPKYNTGLSSNQSRNGEPQTEEVEWFQPLLEKALKDSKGTKTGSERQETEPIPTSIKSEDNGAISILGI